LNYNETQSKENKSQKTKSEQMHDKRAYPTPAVRITQVMVEAGQDQNDNERGSSSSWFTKASLSRGKIQALFSAARASGSKHEFQVRLTVIELEY